MSGRTRYIRRVRAIDHRRHVYDAWLMREMERALREWDREFYSRAMQTYTLDATGAFVPYQPLRPPRRVEAGSCDD